MALTVGSLVAYLGLDTSDFDERISSAETSLSDNLPKVALGAGVAVGAALAAGAAGAMELEDANAKLQAQLGLNKEEFGRIGKAAGEIYAGNYGESMEEVNEAVRSVMSNIGGMSTASNADLQSVTKNVLSVAGAFDQDLGETTAAVGQLMRTGLAPDAATALDIVTKGLQSAANNGGDLLGVIGEYSTTFQGVGLDGAAAVGVLNQALAAGIPNADFAADAIREMGIIIGEGSEESAAALADLGLNASGIQSGFLAGGAAASTAMDQVLDALRTTEDPLERNRLATTLVGTQYEDLGDALLAMDPSEAAKGLGELAGSAQQVNDTLGQTASGNLESFKRQLQTTFVDVVGGKVLPAITTAATFLASNLGPAIQAVTGWVRENSEWLLPLAGFIGGVVVAWGAWSAAMAVVRGATAAYIGVQAALNVVMAANPIGLVVLALAGLAAAVVLAWKNSETFRDVVTGVWGAVSGAVKSAIDWITGTALPGLQAAWDAVTGGAKAAVTAVVDAWGWVKTSVSDAARWVLDFLTTNWPTILTIVGGPVGALVVQVIKHWDDIKAGVSAAWSWIRDEVFKPLGQFVTVDVPGFFAAAVSGVGKAWDWIKDTVRKPLDWIRDNVFTPYYTFWTVTVPSWFGTAVGAVGRAWDAISGAVRGPIDWIRDHVFSPWQTMLTVTVPGYFTAAANAIGTAWDAVKGKAKEPIRFVINTVLNDGIIAAFNKISGTFGVKALDRIPLPQGFANGTEDHRAQIASAGQMRLWAEPETGGEAYIPLANAKRGRSTEILSQVAQGFGYQLTPYADGGIVGLGHWFQKLGARVSEHPAFGGVNPVHKGKGHYEGRAIDVNFGPGGQNATEMAFFDRYAQQVRDMGFKVLWRVAGHFNHLHAEGPKGFLGKITDAIGGSISSVSDFLSPFDGIMGKLNDSVLASPFGKLAAGAGSTLIGKAKDWITQKAKGLLNFGGSDSGIVGEYDGRQGRLSPSDARAAGKSMLPPGWSWDALNSLWNKESGWRWDADNPSSSAYGIPQALPGSKMRSAGGDWATNAITQIRWGLQYIKDRYGNSDAAWKHSQRLNWYAAGTRSAGPGLAMVGERGPELVDFRGGERVYNAQDTQQLLQPRDERPNVTVYQTNTIDSEATALVFSRQQAFDLNAGVF